MSVRALHASIVQDVNNDDDVDGDPMTLKHIIQLTCEESSQRKTYSNNSEQCGMNTFRTKPTGTAISLHKSRITILQHKSRREENHKSYHETTWHTRSAE